MLTNKLPKEINLLLIRKVDPTKGLWEIEEIMRELSIELKARKRCITEKETKEDTVHCPVRSSTEALMAIPSLYCQVSHFPDKYDVVTNLETKKTLEKVTEKMFQLHQERKLFKKFQIEQDLFQVRWENIIWVFVTNQGEVRSETARKSH